MSEAGNIRRVFPGGNTSKGFYSFYQYIVRPDANKIYVIKGGPGVGKSSFMKKIAKDVLSMGLNVEYHHCSSDNNSIDGIYILEWDIAFIDGTAPHIVDPKNPGAVDEIIHLGDYWDETGIRESKAKVIMCNKEVGRLFSQAYRSLAAAKKVNEQYESCVVDSRAMDIIGLNRETRKIASYLFDGVPVRPVVQSSRHLFATAITPDGYKNYLDTIFGKTDRRVVLIGLPGTGKATLIKSIGDEAAAKGYDVEYFHCSFDPVKIDHVYIPQLNIGIINGSEPHNYPVDSGDYLFDTGKYIDESSMSPFKSEMYRSETIYNDLMSQAIEYIKKAKQVHDEMERFYVRCMDFDAIENRRKQVLKQAAALGREYSMINGETAPAIN